MKKGKEGKKHSHSFSTKKGGKRKEKKERPNRHDTVDKIRNPPLFIFVLMNGQQQQQQSSQPQQHDRGQQQQQPSQPPQPQQQQGQQMPYMSHPGMYVPMYPYVPPGLMPQMGPNQMGRVYDDYHQQQPPRDGPRGDYQRDYAYPPFYHHRPLNYRRMPYDDDDDYHRYPDRSRRGYRDEYDDDRRGNYRTRNDRDYGYGHRNDSRSYNRNNVSPGASKKIGNNWFREKGPDRDKRKDRHDGSGSTKKSGGQKPRTKVYQIEVKRDLKFIPPKANGESKYPPNTAVLKIMGLGGGETRNEIANMFPTCFDSILGCRPSPALAVAHIRFRDMASAVSAFNYGNKNYRKLTFKVMDPPEESRYAHKRYRASNSSSPPPAVAATTTDEKTVENDNGNNTNDTDANNDVYGNFSDSEPAHITSSEIHIKSYINEDEKDGFDDVDDDKEDKSNGTDDNNNTSNPNNKEDADVNMDVM